MTSGNTHSAVVVNASSLLALPVVRSLGRSGISVCGIFGGKDVRDIFTRTSAASRYWSQRCFSFDSDEAIVDEMMQYGQRSRVRSVLFPISDDDVLRISEYREMLAPHYSILLPTHDIIESVMDKCRFVDLARQYTLPVPQSVVIDKNSSANNLSDLDALSYPCIVKPDRRSHEWNRLYRQEKAFVAEDHKALLASIDRALVAADKLVVQDLINGPESNIVCTFGVFDHQSAPLVTAACRKVRQYPRGAGSTALAETVHADEAIALTCQIAMRLKLKGYVSIEFKRDTRDDTLKIIEITLNRQNLQASVTAKAGVDLTQTIFKLQSQAPEPCAQPTIDVHPGVQWASEINELRAIKAYRAAGELSLIEWLWRLKAVDSWQLACRDDWRPALTLVGERVRRQVSPRLQ